MQKLSYVKYLYIKHGFVEIGVTDQDKRVTSTFKMKQTPKCPVFQACPLRVHLQVHGASFTSEEKLEPPCPLLVTPHPVLGEEGEPEDRCEAGERGGTAFRKKTQKGKEVSLEDPDRGGAGRGFRDQQAKPPIPWEGSRE